MKILVIDDDREIIQTLTTFFSTEGHEVLGVENASEGKRLALIEKPDLAFIDIRLPDMDGLRVCERLADGHTTCGIPIILLSGMTRPDIIRCSRAAGCDYYVRKPYDPNALLTLIELEHGRAVRNSRFGEQAGHALRLLRVVLEVVDQVVERGALAVHAVAFHGPLPVSPRAAASAHPVRVVHVLEWRARDLDFEQDGDFACFDNWSWN